MKNKYTRPSSLLLIIFVALILKGCFSPAPQDKTDTEKPELTWYRNSFIYNLDVDAFQDSDGDGIGDFKGLISRLDYLKELGVDVIWLSPFQPTPDNDDGYDITDYYGIDKRLGDERDFKSFIKAAKKHNIKVIMDLVLNHTSIEHPWYKAAREDTTSGKNSWYVWSKSKPKDFDKGMVFPGAQTETWTWDDVARHFYFHRFYDFQPDLNYQNNKVRQEAAKVLKYWLAKGLDGFRLDAVPFIIDIPETGTDKPEHMFNILTTLRDSVNAVNPQAILLGEANVTAEENKDYFGSKGERLQMMFNFYANQHLFFSLADHDPAPFAKSLEDFREKPGSAQWAFFLRNHDEVDLARLSKSQRKKVFDQFGPETNMQLYERGIRRRLAPMLADSARIKMAYSLLFSLPGAPVIRYGEELGMGDDLTLKERLSVRTPMQWDTSKNAGFSKATKTFRPVIGAGDYAFSKINVQSELVDKVSLLSFIRQLVALRKQHPEIGVGNWEIIKNTGKVLAVKLTYIDKTLIATHNFDKKTVHFSLSQAVEPGIKLVPLISPEAQKVSAGKFVLPPYGYQWFKVKK